MERLYVIVRQDLPHGDVLCQAVHAAVDYCLTFVGRSARWHDLGGNNLVVLGARDEDHLHDVLDDLERRGFRHDWVTVREPDLGDTLTAIAVGDRARPWLSHLPLALRARNAEPAMA